MGYAPCSNRKNVCPAATARAFAIAAAVKAASLPSVRMRQGPDASQNARPKRAPGTVVTTISARSSTVLMKWDCPATRLHSAGISS